MSAVDLKDNPVPEHLAHVPANTVSGLMAMNAMKPLANLENPDEVINRLLDGESIADIAKSFGLHQTAVYAWLLRNYPDQWMEIKASSSLVKLDECEEILNKPVTEETFRVDGVETNRAAVKIRAHQWNLERANRKLFGDRPMEITVNTQVGIIEYVVVDSGD